MGDTCDGGGNADINGARRGLRGERCEDEIPQRHEEEIPRRQRECRDTRERRESEIALRALSEEEVARQRHGGVSWTSVVSDGGPIRGTTPQMTGGSTGTPGGCS
ncbi:unnamed protein product [Lota lota]